jgi:hypothetical protein
MTSYVKKFYIGEPELNGGKIFWPLVYVEYLKKNPLKWWQIGTPLTDVMSYKRRVINYYTDTDKAQIECDKLNEELKK